MRRKSKMRGTLNTDLRPPSFAGSLLGISLEAHNVLGGQIFDHPPCLTSQRALRLREGSSPAQGHTALSVGPRIPTQV